jgi:hypothetical protein
VALVASPTNPAGALLLQPGDSVNVRSDLHLKKPGVVVLKRDHTQPDEWNAGSGAREPPALSFSAGDTLLLLSYIGEGFWKASYKGRQMEVLEFWGPGDGGQSAIATGTAPVIDTWWAVSRAGRVVGWWKKDSTNAIVPTGEHGRKRGVAC